MNTRRNSLFNWLGRQIGHVRRAIMTPVPEVVYRKECVQQAQVAGESRHVLRRTTVDEVIVDPKRKNMGETPMPRD